MAGGEIPNEMQAAMGAAANIGGLAPHVEAGAGILAAAFDADANNGGVALNDVGAGAEMQLVAPGVDANHGGLPPNGQGMLAAPALAPGDHMFNIDEALLGGPLRKSEVGPFFFF
ncbi:hypothetical protein M758_3G208900 [Ceratodon purpureus]|nr:hypothetical protein M758_3G208900 [Ceratodon purpureus]